MVASHPTSPVASAGMGSSKAGKWTINSLPWPESLTMGFDRSPVKFHQPSYEGETNADATLSAVHRVARPGQTGQKSWAAYPGQSQCRYPPLLRTARPFSLRHAQMNRSTGIGILNTIIKKVCDHLLQASGITQDTRTGSEIQTNGQGDACVPRQKVERPQPFG